jgi:hypothetical protein
MYKSTVNGTKILETTYEFRSVRNKPLANNITAQFHQLTDVEGHQSRVCL